MSGGTIQNLVLDNFDITGYFYTGSLIGQVNENFHIENVIAQNGSVTGGEKVGGLIGELRGSIYTVLNSHVKNVDVVGSYRVGGLVGYLRDSRIVNSSVQGGSVKALRDAQSDNDTGKVGGLVGVANNSEILDSYSNTNVSGESYVGGLVGESGATYIQNSYATGNVSGNTVIGGLVGGNYDGIIEKSYATGNVTKKQFQQSDNGIKGTGGLVGINFFGTIKESYATGNVSGIIMAGGLVGVNVGSIENSYAIGNVSAVVSSGGLVGGHIGIIINSYATNSVTLIQNENVSFEELEIEKPIKGGLVGYMETDNNEFETIIINSFYNKTLNPGMEDEVDFGKTTAQLQDINTFKNDSEYEWSIVEDSSIEKGTPILAWQVGKDGEEKPVWLIASKAASKPTTETPNKEIDKIITTIVNKESVNVPTPVKVTTTPNNSGKNTNVSFNVGENRQLVSKPIEGQTTKIITMSQAKQMQEEATGQSLSETRVPLSRDSQIVIVNDGVLLVGGVEQQFFVSEDEI